MSGEICLVAMVPIVGSRKRMGSRKRTHAAARRQREMDNPGADLPAQGNRRADRARLQRMKMDVLHAFGGLIRQSGCVEV